MINNARRTYRARASSALRACAPLSCARSEMSLGGGTACRMTVRTLRRETMWWGEVDGKSIGVYQHDDPGVNQSINQPSHIPTAQGVGPGGGEEDVELRVPRRVAQVREHEPRPPRHVRLGLFVKRLLRHVGTLALLNSIQPRQAPHDDVPAAAAGSPRVTARVRLRRPPRRPRGRRRTGWRARG